MRVLLTGASSFIGGHVARHLLEAGHTLTATYRNVNDTVSRLAAHPARPSMMALDLADREQFGRLPGHIDAIVHVAGVSIMPGVGADEMLACNVAGTQNVIAYARAARAGMLIHASTLSVHGRIEEAVVDEATPVRDPDIYGASKYLAERLISAEAAWLPAVAIRLPGVLGARAPHRAWLPTLIARLRRHEPVTIYNPDAPFNNAAHVDDIGRFCCHLLGTGAKGYEAFPIGAAGQMTVAEAVAVLARGVGSRSSISVGEARQAGFTISSAKAESLGYRPMEVETMLARFAAETGTA